VKLNDKNMSLSLSRKKSNSSLFEEQKFETQTTTD